jgi:hypothetical protein
MTSSIRTRCLGVTLALAAWSAAPAWAQAPAAGTPAPTSVGPGRIICHNATACDLGIGSPVSLKYKIDPSALPAADKDRLTKQCTAKGTPCVATVTGTEGKAGVKAASIKFYN